MSTLSLARDEVLAAVARHASKRRKDNKAALHAEIEAQTREFLARGGQIEAAVSPPITCYKPEGAKGSIRRYVTAPAPINDIEQIKAVHARQRTAGQRIILPGSHEGEKP